MKKYQADRIKNSVRTDAEMHITTDRIKTVQTLCGTLITVCEKITAF